MVTLSGSLSIDSEESLNEGLASGISFRLLTFSDSPFIPTGFFPLGIGVSVGKDCYASWLELS